MDPLTTVLIRYGAVPEVAMFACGFPVPRRSIVVVRSHRGLELGQVLDVLRQSAPEAAVSEVVRIASEQDLQVSRDLKAAVSAEFPVWERRIADWGLDLQLIDLEWTLDKGKLILYVLNERGPECTKLALQAAAAGLGIVEVQPVSSDGPVTVPSTGGGSCGSCGCH